MNTARNMQPISIDDFRRKRKQEEKVYTEGDRALTMKEVAEKVGASRSSINRWIQAGEFVPKRYFGKRVVRFLESDVDAWMKAQERKNNAP